MQEHELVTYRRVQGRLDNLSGGMRIETHGPLIKALDRLSCVPFVSFPVAFERDSQIVIAGEEAGTLAKPDVDVILKHSKPSPFGKGEETVMDETYRRGREISGADVTFPGYNMFLSEIQSVVSAALFVPRNVTVKLYKLAIYREGGHFDWHRDTTHSDNHHATVLVALNTSWAGGDFILRRNGIETRMDMKPKVIPPRRSLWGNQSTTALAVVAFYTDTEHRVEPVTDGVRIVLQYDVEVVGWSSDKKWGKGKQDKARDEGGNADNKKLTTEHKEKDPAEGRKRKEKQDEDEDDDGEDDDEDQDDDMKDETEDDGSKYDDSDDESNYEDMEVDTHDSTLEVIGQCYWQREALLTPSQVSDPPVVDDVVDIVAGLLTCKGDEVAFALHYLYRKSSILPKFLKGSDSLLYQALSKTFDVSLHPILLEETTDYEGGYGTHNSSFRAYIFDQGADEREDDQREDDDKKKSTFFVSHSSAIMQVSQQSYVEYTGNEAMPGEDRYFGGGMFVRRKDALQGA